MFYVFRGQCSECHIFRFLVCQWWTSTLNRVANGSVFLVTFMPFFWSTHEPFLRKGIPLWEPYLKFSFLTSWGSLPLQIGVYLQKHSKNCISFNSVYKLQNSVQVYWKQKWNGSGGKFIMWVSHGPQLDSAWNLGLELPSHHDPPCLNTASCS